MDIKKLNGDIVLLKDVPLNLHLIEIKRAYEAQYGIEPMAKKYPLYEWARLSYVMHRFNQVDARSVLDIGVGQGVFINAIALSKQFEKVEGIDIRSYQYFMRLTSDFILSTMNVKAMTYPSNSFDIVICMEVLEHLSEEEFVKAIPEIRRVASKRIIYAVPFYEPRPLPDYHKRFFDTQKLLDLFPKAKFTLLLKEPITRFPWVLIEEIV